ncbi:MAG TPA: hypothetical protein VF155_06680 [Candidatus Dormibacteraeota bacterium]
MPQLQHRRPRSRFRLTRLRGIWLRGSPRARPASSGEAPATSIESAAEAAVPPRDNRVADMIAAHTSGRAADVERRPRANPAFAEAVFVELMRAHQYRRAFDLLSRDCRRTWGSPQAFAAAQAQGSMGLLRGVRVNAVRHLPEWTDPERGVTHHEVAELEVEYALGTAEAAAVKRVVHLVADDGKWRSLCYPPGTDR